jgi:ketosteroid isomerase-like protein
VPVSDADVAHVRRAYTEWNERFDELAAGGLEDWHADFYTPDSVIENVDGFPTFDRYEGLEGYREYFAQSYGDYEDVHWRVTSIEAAGDRVLALGRISGTGKQDKVELTIDLGITYEMRDGKIAHVRVYLGHERAADAARNGD